MGNVDQRLPLYQRLRDEIAAQIASHVWRPGEAIPTEAELAASHSVAVGTVRKAIQTLVDEGLVERFQGRGTFVRRPSFDSSLFRFLRFHGPEGRHEVPESKILDRSGLIGPDPVIKALRLPTGTEVIRLLRQRLIKGWPVLAEEIWLPRARFEPILTMPLDEMGALLYPAYERFCGEIVASAEETLTVEGVAAPFDTILSLPQASPVVVIERLAFGYHGGPLEWRRSCAPASTFRYHIEIR
ncbi:GntR family transcriptional regulator [Telmatospirillum siberiense]|uniref:GntR family transcriptional regulator n=1 Tax=Telmatospirillum siberiense TaxID=382514 RepID=A0A2N3PXA5_9PROT|nr:GntR family transcriptional regulator [Telmatospirillum siberiense]PKU25027.1 GntR family transcriptional regulator [Telmatospirillum siberiense]